MQDLAQEIESACSPEGGCGSDELFALMVMGDEMMPEFEDGAIIVIDPSGQPADGKFVVAELEEEYTFRQLVIEEQVYYLRSLKQPERKELLPRGRLAIKGVVVQQNGPTRRRKDRKHYTYGE
ncbi:MAG: S24 family peptidase [Gammaproteobacteria bacterium]|nr:S24 family peptidase [Gammaproteobacteria bacterium]